MTAIEIIALCFALLVALKVLIVLISPKAWLAGVTKPALKHAKTSTVLALILALIVGYYVFSAYSVIEVAAIMAFTTLLIDLSLLPYGKSLLSWAENMMKEGMGKAWIAFLVWIGIAAIVLYELLPVAQVIAF